MRVSVVVTAEVPLVMCLNNWNGSLGGHSFVETHCGFSRCQAVQVCV